MKEHNAEKAVFRDPLYVFSLEKGSIQKEGAIHLGIPLFPLSLLDPFYSKQYLCSVIFSSM